MRLRFSTSLIMGAVLAVSSLAHAKTPVKSNREPVKGPEVPLTASFSGLAQVEAIFSYCESVDPHSAAKYERMRNLVMSGQSTGKGDDGRSSTLQSELAGIEAQLFQIPVSTGVSSCRTVIAGL